MDDVRIFAKDREHARLALFEMARKLRELHLNVQTAKTRIYDENSKEISHLLIDERVDRISSLIDDIQSKYRTRDIPEKKRAAIIQELDKIAKEKGQLGQSIIGTKRPLEGLTLRLFSRWVTAHLTIGSDRYVPRLLHEISKSADYKLTKKLIATTRSFPKKYSIDTHVLGLIKSGKIIYPYQEAECLRALRYLGRISTPLRTHAWSLLLNRGKERYLRMEAAYLLSRTAIEPKRFTVLRTRLRNESDP